MKNYQVGIICLFFVTLFVTGVLQQSQLEKYVGGAKVTEIELSLEESSLYTKIKGEYLLLKITSMLGAFMTLGFHIYRKEQTEETYYDIYNVSGLRPIRSTRQRFIDWSRSCLNWILAPVISKRDDRPYNKEG